MIGVLAPAFLAAGAALALVAVGLHLLSRRPPGLKPLPTARFLRDDPRTLLAVERRPRDLPLLLVRVAFALTAGAAFAGLTWTPDREGSAHVVLVDGGASASHAWPQAAETAGAAARGASASDDERTLILAYGLADGTRVVEPGDFGELRTGAEPATFEGGLRDLRRHLVEETRLASARVTWITVADWRGWTEGFGLLRPALWPGPVELVALAPPAAATRPAGGTADAPLGVAPGAPPAGALSRGIDALGWAGGAGSRADPQREADVVFAGAPDGSVLASLLERARGGATVVVWGEVEDPAGALPWRPLRPERDAPEPGALVLPGGLVLEGAPSPVAGAPRADARILAAVESGAPAAAARPLGDGCLVYSAVPLDDPSLARAPDFPRLLQALGTGCEPPPGGRLDAGALALLRGTDPGGGPVDVAALALAGGRSLTPALVILALLLLAADVVLARGRAA